MAEIAADFVVWEWDTSEGATGYEADIFEDGTPPDERTRVHTEAPSYRWGNLAPDTSVGIFVRAVRETAGGRAVSDWSDRGGAITLAQSGTHECSNERADVLAYEAGNRMASEWNPKHPFRFHFDEEALTECGKALGFDDFFETEIVGRIATEAARFSDRLGYSVFVPRSASKGRNTISITVLEDSNTRCLAWANVREGEIVFTSSYCDPTCRPPRRSGTVIHELAHILGMRHHDRGEPDDRDSRYSYGLEMSELIDGVSWHARRFTDYDMDRLGCAYANPDFPRLSGTDDPR